MSGRGSRGRAAAVCAVAAGALATVRSHAHDVGLAPVVGESETMDLGQQLLCRIYDLLPDEVGDIDVGHP